MSERRFIIVAITLTLALPQLVSGQNCNLEGAWEVHALTLTDADGTVNVVEISDPPGLKILSKTHFIFVEQNGAEDAIPTSGGGGTYTVTDSTFTEFVQYHAARDYIGKTIVFDCKVEGAFWYQTGVLPDGTKLEEVYRRAGMK